MRGKNCLKFNLNNLNYILLQLIFSQECHRKSCRIGRQFLTPTQQRIVCVCSVVLPAGVTDLFILQSVNTCSVALLVSYSVRTVSLHPSLLTVTVVQSSVFCAQNLSASISSSSHCSVALCVLCTELLCIHLFFQSLQCSLLCSVHRTSLHPSLLPVTVAQTCVFCAQNISSFLSSSRHWNIVLWILVPSANPTSHSIWQYSFWYNRDVRWLTLGVYAVSLHLSSSSF